MPGQTYSPAQAGPAFDPTNSKRAGSEHVSVAVAREQEKASPLSGAWEGLTNAFDHMSVSVQVSATHASHDSERAVSPVLSISSAWPIPARCVRSISMSEEFMAGEKNDR
jgi:hypothetical protein